MVFAAGQKLTAAQLNNITMKHLEARCSGNQVVTTSEVDVAGATLTFTTPVANTVVSVHTTWAIDASGTTAEFVGKLRVDGVTSTLGDAKYHGPAGFTHATVYQSYTITLAAAGSHTILLRCIKSIAADTLTLFGTHTKIKVEGLGLT